MFDMLLNADIWLFRLINDGMQNAVFDFLAPLLTNKKNWTPIFIIVVVALAWKGGYRGRVALLLTIPVILLSDQISATFIKPMVARIRPCVALDNVNALIGIKSPFLFRPLMPQIRLRRRHSIPVSILIKDSIFSF